jgi:hypothetical protein
VADLMARAEAADRADIPDGMSIPEELARREEPSSGRWPSIAPSRRRGRPKSRRRARSRAASHRFHRLSVRGLKDQINLTDEDSRIMPVAGGEFKQCYNAQAVVATESLLVIATDVVQAPNDKQQIAPTERVNDFETVHCRI